MPDDLDLSVFPDFDLPSSLTADSSTGNVDTGEVMLRFDFCVQFNGRPWGTVPVNAPSPELALLTMSQYMKHVLIPAMVSRGYPPSIFTFSAGAC